MTHDQMPEFVKLLAMFSLSYGESLNEISIERYWQTLENFELATINMAFQTWATQNPDTGHLMPQPTDILRYLQGNNQTRALQAWSKVTRIIRNVGSYESVVFDDAIVHQVIDEMGGWRRLCESTSKDLSFLRHQFQQLYITYILSPPAKYPRQLSGRFGQQGHLGEAVPLLIGDPEKAAQIYHQGCDADVLIQKTQLHKLNHALTHQASTKGMPLLEEED